MSRGVVHDLPLQQMSQGQVGEDPTGEAGKAQLQVGDAKQSMQEYGAKKVMRTSALLPAHVI